MAKFKNGETTDERAKRYVTKFTAEELAKKVALMEYRNQSGNFAWDNADSWTCPLKRSIQTINNNLMTVLKEYGLVISRLRVEYITEDCDNCPFYCGEQCCSEGHYDDECAWKRMTRVCSFYFYEIDNDLLEGISAELEEESYKLIRVVDERTGHVLYEKAEA